MPAGYGAVSLELPTPRGARSVNKPAVAVSALLAVCGAALLVGSGLSSSAHRRNEAVLLQAARMNMVPLSQTQMLCEGHFLDTATGIPDGTYSTLSHPAELEGYSEPLPADMRAKIDAEVYGSMVHTTVTTHPHTTSHTDAAFDLVSDVLDSYAASVLI
jgi:hypothetical protein